MSSHEEWIKFKNDHGKNYDTEEEEQLRKKIWEENKTKIEEHNKKYDNGEVTYKMGVNKFCDLKPEEMKMFTGLRRPQN